MPAVLAGADPASDVSADRPTPVSLLDRALSLLRRASPSSLWLGVSASLPLAAAVLGAYYLERVEGVHAPLWLFGLGAACAYVFRFARLSRLARELVQLAAPGLPPPAAPAGALELASTAVLAGVGACLWAALFTLLGRSSVFLAIALLPVLSLRGALAPSLLARAACAPERGALALKLARADTEGARALMLGLYFLQCLCVLWMFANLYALSALVLLLAGSVLGLDVAFIAAFLTPDNELVPVIMLGLAGLLLEPLHAACSALAFAAARERKDGADLHAAIDALAGQVARAAPRRAAGPLLALGLCCAAAQAHAAPAPAQPPDAELRSHVERILQRHEFRELDPGRDRAFKLWDWLLDLLRRQEQPDRAEIGAPRFELRLPPGMVVLLSLVLLLAVLGFVSREVRRALPAAAARGGHAGPSLVPGPRSLDEQLTEAERLAQAGAYSEALRALHAAALVLSVRSAGQRFDASRTDGQYLGGLPPGPVRDGFARIASSFERAWYGRLPVGREEYAAARAALEPLMQAAAPRSQAPEPRA